MCYLCQPDGDKARKAIQAAAKVWGRKAPGTDEPPYIPSWGDSHDWTLPPAKAKAWTAKDFDRYQQRSIADQETRHVRANTVGYGLMATDLSDKVIAWEKSYPIRRDDGPGWELEARQRKQAKRQRVAA